MTRDEVKKLTGLKDKHDAYIDEMLPIMIDEAKDYCNQTFLDDDAQQVLPGAVKLFVAKAIEFNVNATGLEARKMGSVSYSYDVNLPKHLYQGLKKFRKVRW